MECIYCGKKIGNFYATCKNCTSKTTGFRAFTRKYEGKELKPRPDTISNKLPKNRGKRNDLTKETAKERETKQTRIGEEKINKVIEYAKEGITLIFGILALLWLIIMLPAQRDFEGFVIGWAIIGGIYLIFRFSSK